MPNHPGKSHSRIFRQKGLAGGLDVYRDPRRIRDDRSSLAENVDFDRDSVRWSPGALKFNNQAAPSTAIQTRVDPISRLAIDSGRSVPVRGHVYIPYSERYDLGAKLNAFDTGSPAPAQFKWHNQRGPSFERSFSFKLPIEERLFEAPTEGPSKGSGSPAYGFDEALDEFTCILQKGGDRKSPMSWAIGVVNTGSVYELQTGEAVADRPSNYALCFMWLDAAQWGHVAPSSMSYKTTSTADLEADGSVEHSTLAYRAIVFDKFIEPGKTYHCALQLRVDSGSFDESGGVFSSTVNNDGFVAMHVLEEDHKPDELESFYFMDRPPAEGAAQSDGVHVWKGPSDSRRYLCVYGVRYHGKDAEFAGLGYRFAPTKDGGYIPFGFDGAPLEHLGFQMIQASETTRADMLDTTRLQQVTGNGADNILSFDHGGLVNDGANTAENGNNPLFETQEWQGLGGTSMQAHNDEALRGYRVAVLANAAAEWPGARFTLDAVQSTGASSITISTLDETVIPNTLVDDFCLIYPFRWNQRETVIANIRHYSTPRDYGLEWDLPDALTADVGPVFYTPSDVAATFHVQQQLTVFYPRKPAPEGGYPVVFVCNLGSYRQSTAKSSIDRTDASERFQHDMIKKGFAVCYAGCTGVDSTGLPGNGHSLFYPWKSPQWFDFSATLQYWPERDIVWARQYLELNRRELGLNTDRIWAYGVSSGAWMSAWMAFGPERAWTNGTRHIQQPTHFSGVIWEAPAPAWIPAYEDDFTGTHWESVSTPGTPAATIADADRTLLEQSSFAYLVKEDGARAGNVPLLILCEEPALVVDFSLDGRGLPSVTNQIDWDNLDPFQTHTLWNAITMKRALISVNKQFHEEQTRLYTGTIQQPMPTAIQIALPPENDDEDLQIFGSTTEPQFQDEITNWILLNGGSDEPARAAWSLASSVDLEDQTEPGISNLVAYWPCNDAGGGLVRELVGGNDAYLAPFSFARGRNGTRGRNTLFLSGEGEAVTLDLEENPVFQREFQSLLRSGTGGFGIEITAIFPEAFYGVDNVGTPRRGLYGPTVASWEVKDQVNSGVVSKPNPLLALTQSAHVNTGVGSEAFFHPLGFSVLVDAGDDQDDAGETVAVYAWPSVGNTNFGLDAPWVGRPVTIQFGIESTGTEDEFRVYLSMRSKDSFSPEDGDPSGAEFAYFSTLTLPKKDVVRSVITIGGRWDPDPNGEQFGYTEMNCRMILDEVRVFGAVPPGVLPATSGGVDVDGNGKLCGNRSLPCRELAPEEILRPLGLNLRTVNVTEDSDTVLAAGSSRFDGSNARDTLAGINGTYLLMPTDKAPITQKGILPVEEQEFYYIDEVAADGSSLTLLSPVEYPTRSSVPAYSLRLFGYTSFDDDELDQDFAVGSGAAFSPGSSTTDDVLQTDALWRNRAPLSQGFGIRIFSPFGRRTSMSTRPKWSRGIVRERYNPILGLTSWDDRVFGGVKGALYEFDDRWRFNDPTKDNAVSLAFLARRYPGSNVLLPLHKDWVTFDSVQNLRMDPIALGMNMRVIDCRIKLDEIGELQTILWLGDANADVSLPGGGKKTNFWVRIALGRPQLVIASTENYAGGSEPPPQGFYVATAERSIQVGETVHIRWYVWVVAGKLKIPACAVEGKLVGVSLNARGTTATADDDWFTGANIVDNSNAVMYLGAARDSFRFESEGADPIKDQPRGLEVQPQRISGMLHSLAGTLSEMVISNEPIPASAPSGSFSNEPQGFQPYQVEYEDTLFRIFLLLFPAGGGPPKGRIRPPAGWPRQQAAPVFHTIASNDERGAGPKVYDDAGDRYGIIHSHPAISLNHETGQSDEPMSFARLGNRIYTANGERPLFIEPETRLSKRLGVLPPRLRPSFEIERVPLWALDKAGQLFGQVAAGVTPKRRHLELHGNNLIFQRHNEEVRWEKTSTDFDTMAFKCVIEPFSTSGRIPLMSARSGLDSGGLFVEIRDGKIAVGWYDSDLKKEVYVETTGKVFEPGFMHYIYVRKRFPSQDGIEGNWENQVTFKTRSFTLDSLVVRRFMREAPLTAYENWPTIAAKQNVRSCVSFTTDDAAVPGTTATGLVTDESAAYLVTGLADGIVNTGGSNLFHPDMIGMLWQWDRTNTMDEAIYRVVDVPSPTQIIVRDDAGNLPTFPPGTYGAEQGGVYAGIGLRKSEDFDLSTTPDSASYDAEFFGSRIARNERSGIKNFRGRVWSFAKHVESNTGNGHSSTGSNTLLFESGGAALADDIEIGTDFWDGLPYQATPPRTLMADSGQTFIGFNTIPYSATPKADIAGVQPNEALELEKAAESSDNASTPVVRRLQATDVFSGRRNVQVVFYDVEQDALSNPSPVLQIEVPEEDRANPSSLARIALKNLPVSSQFGQVERWVYVSVADGQTALRAAIIPDNESGTYTLEATDLQLASRLPVEVDNFAPPRCRVVASTQNSLFFGGLVGIAEDAYLPGKPGFPGSARLPDVRRFVLGGGKEITAMAFFKGRLLIFKRDAITRLLYRDDGIPIEEPVSENIGAPGPQSVVVHDDYVAILSPPRGLYVYAGTGAPRPAGDQVQPIFDETGEDPAKPQLLKRASMAVNRSRNQVVASFQVDGDLYSRDRISCELASEMGPRYSRYVGPNVTALASALKRNGGKEILVSGTQEGFVVWMDRIDTSLMLRGTDEGEWGSLQFVASGFVNEKEMGFSSGSPDLDLESVRGMQMRWVDQQEPPQEHMAVVLFATDDAIHFDSEGDFPEPGTRVVVGAVRSVWRSRWFDWGVPEAEKQNRRLDIVVRDFDQVAPLSGSVRVKVFVDFNTNPCKTTVESLANGYIRVDLNEQQGQHFAFQIESDTPEAGELFEMLDFVVQTSDTEQQ